MLTVKYQHQKPSELITRLPYDYVLPHNCRSYMVLNKMHNEESKRFKRKTHL
jgi:hypothetical protein